MARLLIGGIPVAKHQKRRLVEQDRIMPLRFPFDSSVVDELVGISPEDAWLPMSLALVQRIRHVWNLITGPPYPATRIPGDEYFFQVLRTSLIQVFQSDLATDDCVELIHDRIPEELPTSNNLESYRYDSDRFESFEQALVRNAVTLGIFPDPRTVEDALASFDRQLDVLCLIRERQIEAAWQSYDLSIAERDSLRESISQRQRRLEDVPSSKLAMALEVLDRIGEIWELLYHDPADLRRYPGDEETYQSYRLLLLRQLTDPASKSIRELVSGRLPRLLPLSEDLFPEQPTWPDMQATLERIKVEVIAAAFEQHQPVTLDHAREPDLDGHYEVESWEWVELESSVLRTRSKDDSAMDDSSPIAESSESKAGRPQSDVTYELSTAMWWKIHDKRDVFKNPTYEEVAGRLTQSGHPIAGRTLRGKVAGWRREGLKWPGPPPEHHQSTA